MNKTIIVNKIFQSIQGEGYWTGLPALFIRLHGCNLKCPWCIAGDTEITMADMTQKPMSAVEVGDCVLGVQFPNEPGRHKYYTTANVLYKASRGMKTTFKLGQLKATADHKVWHNTWWRKLGTLHEDSKLVILPIERKPNLEAGWLAGVLDGDGWMYDGRPKGSYHVQAAIASRDEELIDAVISRGEALGFHFHRGYHNRGHGDMMPLASITDRTQFDALRAFIEAHRNGLGYLSGMLDADGSWNGATYTFHQKAGPIMDTIKRVLTTEGFTFTEYANEGANTLWLTGGQRSWLRLPLNGNVVLERKRTAFLGIGLKGRTRVGQLPEKADKAEVFDITTTTGNFFAGGVLVKNCDTKETWAGNAGEGQIYTTRQVADVINDTVVPNIVFTGGEPLIQADAIKHIQELTADHSPSHYFHVETNGTLPIPPLLFNWVTVSPKPPDYLIPSSFDELKFVVTGEDVLKVALEFRSKYPFKLISLQPVSNQADMIQLCTEFLLSHRLIPAIRLSIQVHKLIGLP